MEFRKDSSSGRSSLSHETNPTTQAEKRDLDCDQDSSRHTSGEDEKGSLYLLAVGGGRWSLDAWVVRRSGEKDP